MICDTLRFTCTRFQLEHPEYFINSRGLKLNEVDTTNNNGIIALTRYNIGNYQYQKYWLDTDVMKPENGYKPTSVVIRECLLSPVPYQLSIEVSLPKVYFGHNLYELTNALFQPAMAKLQALLGLYGIHVSLEELCDKSRVTRIDYGRNIALPNEQVILIIKILKILSKGSIYESNAYDYNNGGVAHAWTNSQNRLVVYNKLPEVLDSLKKAKDSYPYIKDILSSPDAFRIEHRLLTPQSIKRELKQYVWDINQHTYPFSPRDVCNSLIASSVIRKHFLKVAPEWKLKTLVLAQDLSDGYSDRLYDAAEGLGLEALTDFWESYALITSSMGEDLAKLTLKAMYPERTLARHQKNYIKLLDHIVIDDWRLNLHRTVLRGINSRLPFQETIP